MEFVTWGTVFIGSYTVFLLSIMLSIGLWVFRDARARGSDQPFLWAMVSVFFFPPLGPLYYLYRRYRRAGFDDRTEPPTKSDRFLAMWANASFIAYVGAPIFSPIGVTALIYTYIWLGVLLPVMYLLVYRGGYRTVVDRISV
jgi:hypothetical protein